MINTAIISPHYDIEYNEEPPREFVMGNIDSSGSMLDPHAAIVVSDAGGRDPVPAFSTSVMSCCERVPSSV